MIPKDHSIWPWFPKMGTSKPKGNRAGWGAALTGSDDFQLRTVLSIPSRSFWNDAFCHPHTLLSPFLNTGGHILLPHGDWSRGHDLRLLLFVQAPLKNSGPCILSCVGFSSMDITHLWLMEFYHQWRGWVTQQPLRSCEPMNAAVNTSLWRN